MGERSLLLPFVKIPASAETCTTSATLRHYPGLTASPPVRYILEVEGGWYPPFRLSAVDGQACGEAVARRAQEDFRWRTQPLNEEGSSSSDLFARSFIFGESIHATAPGLWLAEGCSAHELLKAPATTGRDDPQGENVGPGTFHFCPSVCQTLEVAPRMK
jgi:hypothetical protein